MRTCCVRSCAVWSIPWIAFSGKPEQPPGRRLSQARTPNLLEQSSGGRPSRGVALWHPRETPGDQPGQRFNPAIRPHDCNGSPRNCWLINSRNSRRNSRNCSGSGSPLPAIASKAPPL